MKLSGRVNLPPFVCFAMGSRYNLQCTFVAVLIWLNQECVLANLAACYVTNVPCYQCLMVCCQTSWLDMTDVI